ncbi:hypothetical protein [Hyella patelloides]|nr:hypothetical protein [Hyella patelloides]
MIEKHTKLYNYAGSKEIKNAVANYPIGIQIQSKQDINNWIYSTNQGIDNSGFIICTFVIDLEGYLCIADRHSEHVACSGGNPVFSAGEIFFVPNKNEYEIAEISNQSTGFCPEPDSWFSVSQALDRIPLNHPGEFTMNFIFRRCVKCGLLNLVKENLFVCADCNTELPKNWNCNLP